MSGSRQEGPGEACRDHNPQEGADTTERMRYYASVPDWEEFQEREPDEDTQDPSFLHDESSADTDLLTGDGADDD